MRTRTPHKKHPVVRHPMKRQSPEITVRRNRPLPHRGEDWGRFGSEDPPRRGEAS